MSVYKKIKFYLFALFLLTAFFTVAKAEMTVTLPGLAQAGSRCGEYPKRPALYYLKACHGNNIFRVLSCRVDNDKCKAIEQQIIQGYKACEKIFDPYSDASGCYAYDCQPKKLACGSKCLETNRGIINVLACNDACDAEQEVCVKKCKDLDAQFEACTKALGSLYDQHDQCFKELYWFPALEKEKQESACYEGSVCASDPKYGASCQTTAKKAGESTPSENAASSASVPLDWQDCLKQCPAVTGSNNCQIKVGTRPSKDQCLNDLLTASQSCQNACEAKAPPRECSATAVPAPFPEVKFGDRSYFAADSGVIDVLMAPDKETNEDFSVDKAGKSLRRLLKTSGGRKTDLTQAFIDATFPDLEDLNFDEAINPADSDVQPAAVETDNYAGAKMLKKAPKPKIFSLGEGATVLSIEGDVDILIPGEIEWRALKQDDFIPAGARVFTGMDADLLISFPKFGAAKVLSFSDFILDQNTIDESCKEGTRSPLLYHLDLRSGDVEVHVEKGSYQGSLRVTTPSATNAVRGTHFWVSYDSAKNISATGVYEGTVAVTDRITNRTMDLRPQADGKPGIAISGSIKTAPQNSSAVEVPSRSGSRLNGIFIALFILVLGGGLFILHKTGKLQPIIQKVLTLIRKDDSGPHLFI